METPYASGQCTCGAVRFALLSEPIFTHCCHCTWCQRETGSAFAVNAMIETAQVRIDGAAPDLVATPSASGKGQKVARCAVCRVAVWSHYATLDTKLAFIRAGTLQDPSRASPDVHIFTSTKQPWVVIPAGAEAYAEFYSAADRARMFGPERMARRAALLEEVTRLAC
ncbi:MAG: GFA family protein [Parvularculaceae bacterium]|nr:GFA family protein [Parvularculaceae bacterium]